MDKDQNFGKALKQLRESKNIDLDKISNFTKININNLNLLEQGNFSFSTTIYVKLFLREYLKYIDPNKVDEIMNQFNNIKNSNLGSSNNSGLTFFPPNQADDEALDLEDSIDNKNNFISNSEYFTPKKIGSIILTIIIIILFLQLVIFLSSST